VSDLSETLARPGAERTAVAAARCADYDFETVRAALREVLAPLGGMAAFV
jgi:uncharacterized protein (DUF362 family)